MPARPTTARFRPARSPVPSTAGGSRGDAGDERPWAPRPARLRSHRPERRRPYYPHTFNSTLSHSLHQTVSSLPALVVHAEQFQGSCHIFRALDPVTRRRSAVRERGVRDRPPGADQLVPDLSGEPEVGVAVVVDMPYLGSSRLGISVPVAGDADPTRTVLIPLLENPVPPQNLALYLRQRLFVHSALPFRSLHHTPTSCDGMETPTSGRRTVLA